MSQQTYPQALDWEETPAAIWRAYNHQLRPVRQLDPIQLESLLGIDRQKQALCRNIEKFLNSQPCNNVLLWGSRGTGKSSLIKAVLNQYWSEGLRLIEVDRDDLRHLPEIVDQIRDSKWRFIIYSDDLSFEEGDRTYKALKSALDGSIEAPPSNVLLCATSNRRHLMPEYMQENLDTQRIDNEIHPGEAVEEKVSLSDRFGLWLSFYPFSQRQYLKIVDAYIDTLYGEHYLTGIDQDAHEAIQRQAVQFAGQRGGRSGRVAYQFVKDMIEPA